jgi:hypothetical protein
MTTTDRCRGRCRRGRAGRGGLVRQVNAAHAGRRRYSRYRRGSDRSSCRHRTSHQSCRRWSRHPSCRRYQSYHPNPHPSCRCPHSCYRHDSRIRDWGSSSTNCCRHWGRTACEGRVAGYCYRRRSYCCWDRMAYAGRVGGSGCSCRSYCCWGRMAYAAPAAGSDCSCRNYCYWDRTPHAGQAEGLGCSCRNCCCLDERSMRSRLWALAIAAVIVVIGPERSIGTGHWSLTATHHFVWLERSHDRIAHPHIDTNPKVAASNGRTSRRREGNTKAEYESQIEIKRQSRQIFRRPFILYGGSSVEETWIGIIVISYGFSS